MGLVTQNAQIGNCVLKPRIIRIRGCAPLARRPFNPIQPMPDRAINSGNLGLFLIGLDILSLRFQHRRFLVARSRTRVQTRASQETTVRLMVPGMADLPARIAELTVDMDDPAAIRAAILREIRAIRSNVAAKLESPRSSA